MGADEPETQGSPLDDVQKSVTEQFQNLSNLLENGVDNASDMLRSTTATAKDEAEKAVGVAQVGSNLVQNDLKIQSHFELTS